MNAPRERAVELRKQADALPDGATKVALLQEAVELADFDGSVQFAYDLRRRLIKASAFASRPDVMLAAFAWNLAQFDRDPASFDRHRLLWQYKWVHGRARGFPDVPRARLEALLDDMERRYREHGSTLRVVAEIRRDYQMHVDDPKAAGVAHRLYRKRKRDRLSDCAACEVSGEVAYLVWRRQWTRALKRGQEALDAGLTCNAEPHCLMGNLLEPLFRLGRLDEARSMQRRGHRLIASDDHLLGVQRDHLEFLALVGDFAEARHLVQRHASAAANSVDLEDRFAFYDAMLLWAERLLTLGTTRIKLRLPAEMPGSGEDDATDLVALRAWLQEQVLEIGGRFDARNGTDGFRQREERRRELLELARAPSGKVEPGDR